MPNTAILKAFVGQPWAIVPEWLPAIGEVLGRGSLVELAKTETLPEAITTKLGQPLKNAAARSTVVDGVAMVPIIGPISPRANYFADISGATSTQNLATDIGQAVENPAVSSILLQIDSPGGQVTGIAELAAAIRNAAKVKPVWAYIEGNGSSAAYWLASAAQKIYASPTAVVGSIGTLATYTDTTKQEEAQGVKRFTVVSTLSPNKALGVDTEQGKAEILRILDGISTVFVQDVAKYRNVSRETVLAGYGQGSVFGAADALEKGMLDGIFTMDEVLTQMAKGKKQMPQDNKTAGNSAADLKAAFPEAVQELQAEFAATHAADIETIKAEHAAALEAAQAATQQAVDDERSRCHKLFLAFLARPSRMLQPLPF